MYLNIKIRLTDFHIFSVYYYKLKIIILKINFFVSRNCNFYSKYERNIFLFLSLESNWFLLLLIALFYIHTFFIKKKFMSNIAKFKFNRIQNRLEIIEINIAVDCCFLPQILLRINLNLSNEMHKNANLYYHNE